MLPTESTTIAPASVQFRILGRIDYRQLLVLQEQVIEDVRQAARPRIEVLLCEHPRLITVGRSGSRAHVRLEESKLARKGLRLHWVARGGGCWLHELGQLAVYPIAPLDRLGWTVGDFVRRFGDGIEQSLEALRVLIQSRSDLAISSRKGVLVAFGMAVRNGITSHGAIMNVHPSLVDFGFVDVIPPHEARPGQRTTMTCLVAERRRPITMSQLRAVLIPHLATAFTCDHYHVHFGYPCLPQQTVTS